MPVLSGFIAPIWLIIAIPIITTVVVGLLFIYLFGAPNASPFDALAVALAGMFSVTDNLMHGGPNVDVFGFFIAMAAGIAVNALLIIVHVRVSNRGNKENKEPRSETAPIAEDIVLLDAEFQSPDEAITALVDTVANAGRIDSTSDVISATLAREEQRFTGVHHRAAIPHARSNAVTQPTLALARLRERGVVWAEGEEPLRLIFPIAVTEDVGKAHLKLLSKLTERDEYRIPGGTLCSYDSLICGPYD
ncbi:PTS sugar transporter subunit IIA [Corynebacterium sp.]|uniref:PTS sugar transporter subunit IIA n=1 Tax=Corynebacterium sp. TaxID=1720 RepID=UPI002649FDFF|nr:PTS sugar transporter subunit IIA [Corynebacterium sp.]MDN6135933.1 PTS sugar transporter subunit IIA [Corynebacterium sp.]MDN6736460.1 PTS sugar transporter subunit IIA [Corynebacterium sp.]